jgi:hypothetical protein
MSEVRSEHCAILLGRSAAQDLPLKIKPRHGQRAAAWSSSAMDKVISCLAIAMLAPAILAVWIAIKRSAPAKSSVSDRTSLEALPSKAPVLLTIKPLRIGVPQKIDNLKIAAKRAISA